MLSRNALVEFANTLSEDDLRFLNSRLTERLQGDIAEALDFLSHYKAIDSVLSVAKTSNEVYNVCDQLTETLQKECKKRGVQIFERK